LLLEIGPSGTISEELLIDSAVIAAFGPVISELELDNAEVVLSTVIGV